MAEGRSCSIHILKITAEGRGTEKNRVPGPGWEKESSVRVPHKKNRIAFIGGKRKESVRREAAFVEDNANSN